MATTNTASETNAEEEKALAESKNKLIIFWLRMLGYLLTSTVAPVTVFAIKFGLFKESGYEVVYDELGNVAEMKIALSGWGIISVVLVGLVMLSIMKEIVSAYSGYSMTKQVLNGLIKRTVPLIMAAVICHFLKNAIDELTFSLIVLAICETAAVPLNPLPQWSASKGEENYDDLLTQAIKALQRGKERK